jgi:phosphoribosylformylglycinamidine cyclo-ligase
MASRETLTYKSAGVDIEAGNALVRRIGECVKRTSRPEVLGGLGGFGGLFEVPAGYREPVLVAATDGVGTKLKLAIENGAHDAVGIDLVAMCANDIVVQGAEPLFFLDYYATPRLDVDIAARVIAGIARGCEIAGAALIGGETAEHPGAGEASGEYDLAGFCVGIAERERLVDGSRIRAGDKIIGLASSGLHSNGFSLVRLILDRRPDARDERLAGRTVIEHLLTPTRIYARALLGLLAAVDVRGMAHITGGGLIENVPRMLPPGLGASLAEDAWPRPPIFQWLARAGVPREELLRTFNCGLGMAIAVDGAEAASAIQCLEQQGERAWLVGEVIEDRERAVHVT